MKKINLGCGDDYKEGWLNVDYDRNIKADVYCDLRRKFPFPDHSFDFILAQDLLEHLTKDQGENFIHECWRILKLKGVFSIRTPNIYRIFRVFKKDPPVLFKFIYGATSGSETFSLHKFAYTQRSLKEILKRHYFADIVIKKETTNFICSAKKIKKDKKSLKVIISLLDSGGLGGAEYFLTNLGKSLRQFNQTIIYYTVKKAQITKYLESENIININLPFRMDLIGNWKGFFKYFLQIIPAYFLHFRNLIAYKKLGYDLLILTGVTDKIVLSPIAKWLGYKVFWLEFAPLSSVFKKNLFVPKILYRLVKSIPEKVIVPTKYTKDHLIPETRISEAKFEIIPCGIILKKENNTKISGPLKTIGMISRIEQGKGQDTLIAAAKYLALKRQDFQILIIGEGNIADLTRAAHRYGVEKYIRFMGFRQDVRSMMSAFDVFTFPTRWPLEGFGLVLLEAMAAKLPIVTTNFGPVPEVVKDAAVLIKINDPKALALAINSLLENKKYRNSLVNKGLKRLKMYNINKIAKKYAEIINDYS